MGGDRVFRLRRPKGEGTWEMVVDLRVVRQVHLGVHLEAEGWGQRIGVAVKLREEGIYEEFGMRSWEAVGGVEVVVMQGMGGRMETRLRWEGGVYSLEIQWQVEKAVPVEICENASQKNCHTILKSSC